MNHIIEFAIAYFTRLKQEYGKGRERQTEIRLFDDIEATKVVIRNTKLYVNRAEGFIGTSLKKDEYVDDCSDIDDIIVFTKDGKMIITKVSDKTYVGKDIIHIAVFKKNDKRTIYNMIYKDGKGGAAYIKRFHVTGITRDKEYDLTQEKAGSEVLYFTANPNGEAEVVTVNLRQVGSIKKLKWDLDFADVLIKGRNSKGNLVTKYTVKRIELKERGVSTLKPRKIWFDDTVQRLNVDGRGELLGEFKGDDRLLIIRQNGSLKTILPDLSTHFDSDMIVLEKWHPKKPISVIYYEGEKERYFVKRFVIENENKDEIFISEHPKTQLEWISTDWRPVAEIEFTKVKGKEVKPNQEINLEEFIAIKGIKALGNQLTADKLKSINTLTSLAFEEPEPIAPEEIEVVEEESVDENEKPVTVTLNPDEGETKTEDDGQITLF